MELKYIEAQRRIISMAASNGYDVGTKFPDETDLSKKIGFSSITIRRAMKELEHSGLISRSRGCGSVLKRKISESPRLASLLFIQTFATTCINERILFPMRQLCIANGYDFRFIHAEKTSTSVANEIINSSGVFITGSVSRSWLNFITALGKPYVVIGEPQCHDNDIMAVSYDWAALTYGVTARLIASGCRRIALCSPPESFASAQGIVQGYRDAVVDGKLVFDQDIIIRCPRGEYSKSMTPFMEKGEFDSIICDDDCYPYLISILYNTGIDKSKIKIGLLDNSWELHLHEIPKLDNLIVGHSNSKLASKSMEIMLQRLGDSSMKNNRFMIKPEFIEVVNQKN